MTALLSLTVALTLAQGPATSWKQASSSMIDGWMEFRASGLSISFPADWNAVEPKRLPKAQLSILPALYTSDASMRNAVSANARSWRFFVVDNSTTTSATPVYRSMAGLHTDTIRYSVVDHLRLTKKFLARGGIPAELYYIDLPIGRAGLVESTIKLKNGMSMDIYTYIVHRGKTEYRFSFAEDSSKGKTMQKLSRTIIKTMRFTG
jgi:hypothetical protein